MTELRPLRVIVTGTRQNGNHIRDAVYAALNELALDVAIRGDFSRIHVIQGECVYGGVDRYAKIWADLRPNAASQEGHPAARFPSPPARNSHMVSLGADLCLGFPAKGSRGTWDCMRKACDAGIQVECCSIMEPAA